MILRLKTGGESIQSNGNGVTQVKLKKRDIQTEFHFRKPNKEDGADVWKLINNIEILDLNSPYSYIMWCELFSKTSIVVERDSKLVGFISGFIHPDSKNTLFIWQVAVNEDERGNGLGTRMLFELLGRTACEEVHYVEATVSPSNNPSQNLFKGLAEKLGAECVISDYFSSTDFPEEGHEDELMFRIGPFTRVK
ncbi:diaminobutyrate acetyltransferase [Cerasibacillus terrae]|uniref:diaminobutyrate acetyltransferase n=1 Tax=Cerasibacillus terrae TaxID=2498845 RepID=UPI002ED87F8A